MSTSLHDRRLEALVHLLLDGDLPPEAAEELAGMLRESAEARRFYRRALAIHSSLVRQIRSEGSVPEVIQPNVVRMPVRRRMPWLALGAAACAILAAGAVIFSQWKGPAPLAVLTGTTAASWADPMNIGHAFAAGRPSDLKSGFAEISYRNGVKVVLEAPCRFEVTGENSMNVTRGRASVKVPKGTSGFQLDTPGGRLVDLGTEFGVAVGSGTEGPVVISEVFDGEIEIPSSASSRQRLKQGESKVILRENGGTRLVSELGEGPARLTNPARYLPVGQSVSEEGVNLALGKPVFSPSYYTNRSGEVFPPDNLTDGRLNDTGSPGDWSFWLAPNGVHGEFTVDLLEAREIGRVDLQNTRNRNHGDRGLRDFVVLVSDDNRDFREVARGTLPYIGKLPPPGSDIPFETFRFAQVSVRYVKVVASSHQRNPDRPTSNPNEGGGLNEIRIFSH